MSWDFFGGFCGHTKKTKNRSDTESLKVDDRYTDK